MSGNVKLGVKMDVERRSRVKEHSNGTRIRKRKSKESRCTSKCSSGTSDSEVSVRQRDAPSKDKRNKSRHRSRSGGSCGSFDGSKYHLKRSERKGEKKLGRPKVRVNVHEKTRYQRNEGKLSANCKGEDEAWKDHGSFRKHDFKSLKSHERLMEDEGDRHGRDRHKSFDDDDDDDDDDVVKGCEAKSFKQRKSSFDPLYDKSTKGANIPVEAENSSANKGGCSQKGLNTTRKASRARSCSSLSSSSTDSDTSGGGSSEDKKSRRKRKRATKESKKAKKKCKKRGKKAEKKSRKGATEAEDQQDGKSLPDMLLWDIPRQIVDRSRAMAPMTKEEWEKKQGIIRRVYDEETGRQRLIKGDGEVLEEIVSRNRCKDINRQATRGDGQFFRSQLGLYK